MAIQILPYQSRGAALGSSMGTGLGQGLQFLLQDKLNRKLQARQRSQTEAALSKIISPEAASAISNLPKELQPSALKNILSGLESASFGRALAGDKKPKKIIDEDEDKADIGKEIIDEDEDKADIGKEIIELETDQTKYDEILKNPNLKPEHRLNLEHLAQNERLARQKQADKLRVIQEGRITTGLQEARKEAKEAQGRVESYRESADNYKKIRQLLKSGKAVTGISAKILKDFGIDKGVTGWESQLMDKMFAAEPIRALRSLPAQAARLTKVFDTLKDMHGSLLNTPEGIDAIARSKIVEAKAAKAIDKKYIQLLENYRKTGRDVPFDLRERAAKAVSDKLNKYSSEIEYIISDSIEKGGAKLKSFGFGEKIIADDGSGRVFVKKKLFGRPTWVPVEG